MLCEIGPGKIGNFFEENRYNMNDTNIRRFITSLDILQKWALNNNQLKKCAIELSACCIEDFRHYIHDDFLDIMGLLYQILFD